ncbi:MAG TPA: hypothetical protein VGM14_18265 [Streptosporangiaceae bacterium]
MLDQRSSDAGAANRVLADPVEVGCVLAYVGGEPFQVAEVAEQCQIRPEVAPDVFAQVRVVGRQEHEVREPRITGQLNQVGVVQL